MIVYIVFRFRLHQRPDEMMHHGTVGKDCFSRITARRSPNFCIHVKGWRPVHLLRSPVFGKRRSDPSQHQEEPDCEDGEPHLGRLRRRRARARGPAPLRTGTSPTRRAGWTRRGRPAKSGESSGSRARSSGSFRPCPGKAAEPARRAPMEGPRKYRSVNPSAMLAEWAVDPRTGSMI